MIGFRRPQDGSKEALKSDSEPTWYWLSPSVRTAVGAACISRSEVFLWRQWPSVPAPPLKNSLAVSQAMSPAAATTGSARACAARLHMQPEALARQASKEALASLMLLVRPSVGISISFPGGRQPWRGVQLEAAGDEGYRAGVNPVSTPGSQSRTAAATAWTSVLRLWSPGTWTTVRFAAAGGMPN